MAEKVVGTHFEVDAREITVFNQQLGRYTHDSWILGGFIQVDMTPVARDVEDVIQADIVAGNEEKIDHILVNEKFFSCLYCEGRVTLADMQNATEDANSITVPNIQFNGKKYTVKVMDHDELNERFETNGFRLATIDAEGAIV